MILYELIRESYISKYARLYAPYNVDIDVAPGQNRTATFVANQPGIFLKERKNEYYINSFRD